MIIERGGAHESGHRDLAKGPIRISVTDTAWNEEADVQEALLNHAARPGGVLDAAMKRELRDAINGSNEFLQTVGLGFARVLQPAGRLARVSRSAVLFEKE